MTRSSGVFSTRRCRHPLAITLANTREELFLLNRPGNRSAHEGAADYFDKSVQLCRRAGFRKVRLRGDTDFSQTTHLDRWHDAGVEFIFGYDAMPNLAGCHWLCQCELGFNPEHRWVIHK